MMKPPSDFFFFESSSIQSSEERIEASQFSMAIFEREESAQIGEGLCYNKRMKCSCEAVISGSSVQSLHKLQKLQVSSSSNIWLRSNLRVPNSQAAETIQVGSSSSIWIRSDLREPNFFWGSMPPAPPSLMTFMHCSFVIKMAILI